MPPPDSWPLLERRLAAVFTEVQSKRICAVSDETRAFFVNILIYTKQRGRSVTRLVI